MVFEDAFRNMLRDEMRTVVREEVREALRVGHQGPEERNAEGRTAADSAEEFLSPANAALFAGVSSKTIRCWVRCGKLRRYSAGRLVRVKRSELEALMGAEAPPTNTRAEDIAARILRGG